MIMVKNTRYDEIKNWLNLDLMMNYLQVLVDN